MRDESHSLTWLRVEEVELEKDISAFRGAYEAICKRLTDSSETERPRRPLLHEWSGSAAVCGSLEMAIHAMERTLHEVKEIIANIVAGEVTNSDKPDKPTFGVVDGGKK